jgi:hypothetical protein
MLNFHAHRWVGVTLVAFTTAGCTSAPWNKPITLGPAETGAGSTAAARKFLEGRWSLVSYDIVTSETSSLRLAGSGMLTYDAFGNMTLEIRVDDQTAQTLASAGIPTADGRLSSSGRTVVDMQQRTLTFVLEGQPALGAPSGPLALNRPRHWEVEGEVLTLKTKDPSGRDLSIGRWQRMP